MLKSLGLEPKTTRAYMPTFCNGKKCGVETRGKKVGEESNWYRCGVEIRRRGDGNFVFEMWTIYDGNHVLNSHVVLNANGKLVQNEKSVVNCFALGWRKMDQEYVDMWIVELAEDLLSGKRIWEQVE